MPEITGGKAGHRVNENNEGQGKEWFADSHYIFKGHFFMMITE